MPEAKDDLAAIRAELKRRGALPKPVTSVEYPANETFQLLITDAVNKLSRSIAELSTTVGGIQDSQANLAARLSAPRVTSVERDAEGNILSTRTIEE